MWISSITKSRYTYRDLLRLGDRQDTVSYTHLSGISANRATFFSPSDCKSSSSAEVRAARLSKLNFSSLAVGRCGQHLLPPRPSDPSIFHVNVRRKKIIVHAQGIPPFGSSVAAPSATLGIASFSSNRNVPCRLNP